MKKFKSTQLLVATAMLLSATFLHAGDVTGDRLNIGAANSLSGSQTSIAGGGLNNIGNSTVYSHISGGFYNDIGTNVSTCNILGGEANIITNNMYFAVIAGGVYNTVHASYAAICAGSSGTVTPNGTGAFIGNGNFNLVDGDYGTIVNGANNTVGAPGGVIVGGVVHTIGSGADYAFIGAGAWNLISTLAEYSSIVGGLSNSIGIHAEYSYVGNGEFNTNNSSWAYLGSGTRNLIASNANYSVLVGGASNKVSGSRATIPGGDSASAANYGQLAYASGRFAAVGDAQSSKYVLRNSTSDTNRTELFLDGSAARMTVPNNSTWTFEGQVVARNSAGASASSAGYKFKGVIDNNNGSTSLVYTPSYETLAEDVGAWDIVVEADNTNDALVVKVTGAASTNIRWVATVHTTEVSY